MSKQLAQRTFADGEFAEIVGLKAGLLSQNEIRANSVSSIVSPMTDEEMNVMHRNMDSDISMPIVQLHPPEVSSIFVKVKKNSMKHQNRQSKKKNAKTSTEKVSTIAPFIKPKRLAVIEQLNSNRLGSTDYRAKCETCPGACMGHPSHNGLPIPVCSIIHIHNVVRICQMICFGCSEILSPSMKMKLESLLDKQKRENMSTDNILFKSDMMDFSEVYTRVSQEGHLTGGNKFIDDAKLSQERWELFKDKKLRKSVANEFHKKSLSRNMSSYECPHCGMIQPDIGVNNGSIYASWNLSQYNPPSTSSISSTSQSKQNSNNKKRLKKKSNPSSMVNKNTSSKPDNQSTSVEDVNESSFHTTSNNDVCDNNICSTSISGFDHLWEPSDTFWKYMMKCVISSIIDNNFDLTLKCIETTDYNDCIDDNNDNTDASDTFHFSNTVVKRIVKEYVKVQEKKYTDQIQSLSSKKKVEDNFVNLLGGDLDSETNDNDFFIKMIFFAVRHVLAKNPSSHSRDEQWIVTCIPFLSENTDIVRNVISRPFSLISAKRMLNNMSCYNLLLIGKSSSREDHPSNLISSDLPVSSKIIRPVITLSSGSSISTNNAMTSGYSQIIKHAANLRAMTLYEMGPIMDSWRQVCFMSKKDMELFKKTEHDSNNNKSFHTFRPGFRLCDISRGVSFQQFYESVVSSTIQFDEKLYTKMSNLNYENSTLSGNKLVKKSTPKTHNSGLTGAKNASRVARSEQRMRSAMGSNGDADDDHDAEPTNEVHEDENIETADDGAGMNEDNDLDANIDEMDINNDDNIDDINIDCDNENHIDDDNLYDMNREDDLPSDDENNAESLVEEFDDQAEDEDDYDDEDDDEEKKTALSSLAIHKMSPKKSSTSSLSSKKRKSVTKISKKPNHASSFSSSLSSDVTSRKSAVKSKDSRKTVKKPLKKRFKPSITHEKDEYADISYKSSDKYSDFEKQLDEDLHTNNDNESIKKLGKNTTSKKYVKSSKKSGGSMPKKIDTSRNSQSKDHKEDEEKKLSFRVNFLRDLMSMNEDVLETLNECHFDGFIDICNKCLLQMKRRNNFSKLKGRSHLKSLGNQCILCLGIRSSCKSHDKKYTHPKTRSVSLSLVDSISGLAVKNIISLHNNNTSQSYQNNEEMINGNQTQSIVENADIIEVNDVLPLVLATSNNLLMNVLKMICRSWLPLSYEVADMRRSNNIGESDYCDDHNDNEHNTSTINISYSSHNTVDSAAINNSQRVDCFNPLRYFVMRLHEKSLENLKTNDRIYHFYKSSYSMSMHQLDDTENSSSMTDYHHSVQKKDGKSKSLHISTTKPSFVSKCNGSVNADISCTSTDKIKIIDNDSLKVCTILPPAEQINAMSFPTGNTASKLWAQLTLDARIGSKNLMGENVLCKRLNFSARMVLKPNANLSVNVLGIPIRICLSQTKPVTVTDYNIRMINYKIALSRIYSKHNVYPDLGGVESVVTEDGSVITTYCLPSANLFLFDDNVFFNQEEKKRHLLTEIVLNSNQEKAILYKNCTCNIRSSNDKSNHHYKNNTNGSGSNIINGNISKNHGSSSVNYDEYHYSKKCIICQERFIDIIIEMYGISAIKNGWLIHMFLKEGDQVLVSRPPILQRGNHNMHSIIPIAGFAMSMNVNCMGPYNADADGDALKIVVPQGIPARCSIRHLMSIENNMICARSHNAITCFKLDSLLGMCLMIYSDALLDTAQISHLLSNVHNITPLRIRLSCSKSTRHYINHNLHKIRKNDINASINDNNGYIHTNASGVSYDKTVPQRRRIKKSRGDPRNSYGLLWNCLDYTDVPIIVDRHVRDVSMLQSFKSQTIHDGKSSVSSSCSFYKSSTTLQKGTIATIGQVFSIDKNFLNWNSDDIILDVEYEGRFYSSMTRGFSTLDLIEMILPDDFCYYKILKSSKKNRTEVFEIISKIDKLCTSLGPYTFKRLKSSVLREIITPINEKPMMDVVIIFNGKWIFGKPSSETFSSGDSIVESLWRNYGSNFATDWLSDMGRISQHYLTHIRGFSCSINDIIVGARDNYVAKYFESEKAFMSTDDDDVQEKTMDDFESVQTNGKSIPKKTNTEIMRNDYKNEDNLIQSDFPSIFHHMKKLERERLKYMSYPNLVFDEINKLALEHPDKVRKSELDDLYEKGEEASNHMMMFASEYHAHHNPNWMDNGMTVMSTTGTKGNATNISQMSGSIGVARLQASTPVGSNIMPNTRNHPDEFYGERSTNTLGFSTNGFSQGLDSKQYFHASKEARVRTIKSGDVAKPGYVNNQTKAQVESLTVHYTRTVKNAHREITQFHYGGDGYDALKVKRFFIPGKWFYIAENGITHTRTVVQLFSLIDLLIKSNISNVTSDFTSPEIMKRNGFTVTCNMDVMNIFLSHSINWTFDSSELGNCSDINCYKNDVCNEFDLFCNAIISYDFTRSLIPLQLFVLVRMLMCEEIFPQSSKASTSDWRCIFGDIYSQYCENMVDAGEAVGALACQCTNQPTTQLVMNSFKIDVGGSKQKMHISCGLPRVLELVRAVEGKTGITNIYFDPSIVKNQIDAMFCSSLMRSTLLKEWIVSDICGIKILDLENDHPSEINLNTNNNFIGNSMRMNINEIKKIIKNVYESSSSKACDGSQSIRTNIIVQNDSSNSSNITSSSANSNISDNSIPKTHYICYWKMSPDIINSLGIAEFVDILSHNDNNSSNTNDIDMDCDMQTNIMKDDHENKKRCNNMVDRVMNYIKTVWLNALSETQFGGVFLNIDYNDSTDDPIQYERKMNDFNNTFSGIDYECYIWFSFKHSHKDVTALGLNENCPTQMMDLYYKLLSNSELFLPSKNKIVKQSLIDECDRINQNGRHQIITSNFKVQQTITWCRILSSLIGQLPSSLYLLGNEDVGHILEVSSPVDETITSHGIEGFYDFYEKERMRDIERESTFSTDDKSGEINDFKSSLIEDCPSYRGTLLSFKSMNVDDAQSIPYISMFRSNNVLKEHCWKSSMKCCSLGSIMHYPFVVSRFCYCTNVLDNYRRFGIDVASSCIAAEAAKVLSNDGDVYVQERHLMTIADVITSEGITIGMSQAGFNKRQRSGFVSQCAFEQIGENIFKYSLSGKYDTLTHTVPNTVFGKIPPFLGSGICRVISTLTKTSHNSHSSNRFSSNGNDVTFTESSVFDKDELEMYNSLMTNEEMEAAQMAKNKLSFEYQPTLMKSFGTTLSDMTFVQCDKEDSMFRQYASS